MQYHFFMDVLVGIATAHLIYRLCAKYEAVLSERIGSIVGGKIGR